MYNFINNGIAVNGRGELSGGSNDQSWCGVHGCNIYILCIYDDLCVIDIAVFYICKSRDGCVICLCDGGSNNFRIQSCVLLGSPFLATLWRNVGYMRHGINRRIFNWRSRQPPVRDLILKINNAKKKPLRRGANFYLGCIYADGRFLMPASAV